MTAHSVTVGGSTAARVLACPPSRLIPRPPERPSPYAQEGSALHLVIEQVVTGKVPDAESFTGVTVDDIEIADAMLDEKVKPALAAFDMYVQHYGIAEQFTERTVSIPIIDGAFGTADVLAYSNGGTRLHVIDWKFGDGHQVSAEGNAQLLFYAAAALFTIDMDIADVHLVVIQPNNRGLPILREWVVDRFHVKQWAFALRWAVLHPDVPRVAGEHCRYCPGRMTCPTLRAQEKALTVWANPHPDVTPAQVSAMLDAAELIEMQISALREHAYEMANAGQPPTNWKLVQKRAVKKWIDDEVAFKRLQELNPGVPPTDLMKPPEPLSPAQVMKKFNYPDDLIEARSSGTTLVRDSDKRSAVIPSDPLKLLAQSIKAKL